MRLVQKKTPLPKKWSGTQPVRGVVLERDLRVGGGKLRAKLLIFNDRVSLRRFWREALGRNDLGRHTQGAVNGLYREVGGALEVDPRYFCVVGLVRGYLGMEIVAHEAVHAAFCYVKRKTRNPWDICAKEMDEEAIAYPAGRIAAEMNRAIFSAGLYA